MYQFAEAFAGKPSLYCACHAFFTKISLGIKMISTIVPGACFLNDLAVNSKHLNCKLPLIQIHQTFAQKFCI